MRLKLGAKIAVFPEGTWNNSPNKIVLKLYPGIYDVAKEANALIVPIATLKGSDRVYSSIGKPIDSNLLERNECVENLRDEMASLKWELMVGEYENNGKYESVPHGMQGELYWSDIINAEIDFVKYYDRVAEQNSVYRDNQDSREVFAFMDNIEISKSNAFLLRKP